MRANFFHHLFSPTTTTPLRLRQHMSGVGIVSRAGTADDSQVEFCMKNSTLLIRERKATALLKHPHSIACSLVAKLRIFYSNIPQFVRSRSVGRDRKVCYSRSSFSLTDVHWIHSLNHWLKKSGGVKWRRRRRHTRKIAFTSRLLWSYRTNALSVVHD